ncbi:multiple epidermal growth factor-like domains protein 6 isoform X3 [Dysidea avara]|uniref:multiple epidermal growth factor-like domains protein 6 isoform X3 n=1 Tax=Dysidea avara TaxID=196820 RepID=UPI00331BD858
MGQQSTAALILIIFVALQIHQADSQSGKIGNYGVCSTNITSYRKNTKTAYQTQYRASYYSYRCGRRGRRRRKKKWCTGSSATSYSQSYIYYHQSVHYTTVPICCPGYDGNPPTCQPICSGGCLNEGNCTLPEVCTCAPGWTGKNCGIDINECLIDNGGCTHTCDNTDGSYQCSCNKGYELTSDGHNCADIEECRNGLHNCSQVCVELNGGFECDCFPGFQLLADRTTCIDIDECLQGTAGCNHGCRNTNGSFICTCNDGYQLYHNDLTLCLDIDECVESNGGCQHVCENTIGSYSCTCHTGYVLGVDDHHCEDVNECEKFPNGGCDHICTNTDGSYYCSCHYGFVIGNDASSCIECQADNGECTQTCENTKGSYPFSYYKGQELTEDNTCTAIKGTQSSSSGQEDSGGLSVIPVAGGTSGTVVVVILILVIIIIIVVRRKRRNAQNINLASAAAQAKDNPIVPVKTKRTDETVQKPHNAAAPGATTQENIYEQPTNNTCDKPASPYENPTNAYLPGKDHEYDVPKNKKTSTSSMSLKESKSRYEQLSTVEEPGDDP